MSSPRLSEGGKVRYSEAERAVFALLPKGSGVKLSSTELAEKHYGKAAPLNARTSIVQTVTKLIRKAELNKEPFTIRKSERRGPRPILFWVEKKKS